MLPQLFDRPQHSLYESLQQFFSHSWHFDILTHQSLSAETILYLVVASTCATNFRYLDRNIRRIAFKDIRQPSLHINDYLHECRQNLTNLRAEVSNAKKWIPKLVREELEMIQASIDSGGYVGFPDTVLDEISAEAETAERFLMETFQLLMSSISVLDSEISIQQAHSGQKLTQLAIIYVPLSFVTSVFGMNIKEINGSPTSAWVCVVALAIAVTSTVSIFSVYNVWDRRKTHRTRKKRLVD